MMDLWFGLEPVRKIATSAGSFCVEAIRGMIETVLHILSKDPAEKPAKRARGKDNEGHKN